MQTDPIADFLTRIRNALTADQDEAVMPASKFKAELARILREQGYIDGLLGRARPRRRRAANPAQVHGGPPLRHPGPRAHLQARPARVRGRGPRAQGAGRHGDDDRLDIPRRDDRPRGAAHGRGRRARREGVVT